MGIKPTLHLFIQSKDAVETVHKPSSSVFGLPWGLCLNVGVFTQRIYMGSTRKLSCSGSIEARRPQGQTPLLYTSPFLTPSIPLSLGATELALSSQHLSTAQVSTLLGHTFPGAGRWLFLPKAL